MTLRFTNVDIIADVALKFINPSCFSLVGNAANKYHLKLKESLLILKMKPLLNEAKFGLRIPV